MELLTTIEAARACRREGARAGRTVALVPTMGALHEGHLELVRRAGTLADEVWASVFVNPTQFAAGEDFETYPRDLDNDRRRLEGEGVAVVFAPGAAEMYPRPPAVRITVGELAAGLCGVFRPGHFEGVALVVAKLLNIVQPEVAVFGAKDFQQAAVIKRLVDDLDIPVRIEVSATVREKDGLAMSSRNQTLDAGQRQAARGLSRALRTARDAIGRGERSARNLEALIQRDLAADEGVRLQYAAAVDAETLRPLDIVSGRTLLAIAAHVGRTRLIDNLVVEVR